MKTKIQTILDTTTGWNNWKSEYYKKVGDQKAEKINQKEYLMLYDSNVEVLPPCTRERKIEQ